MSSSHSTVLFKCIYIYKPGIGASYKLLDQLNPPALVEVSCNSSGSSLPPEQYKSINQ